MKKTQEKKRNGLHVKKYDKVVVISGKAAKAENKIGVVKDVDAVNSRVVVEGVNIVTKAVRPNPMAGVQGGLTKFEAPIDSSNVMLVCPACEKPTRIKYEVRDGKKVRICKKCGEQIDNV